MTQKKLLFLVSILTDALKKSQFDKLSKADVLLVCHDVNKSYVYKNLAYSPLMDSLDTAFKESNYTTIHVSTPGSKFQNNNTWSRSINLDSDIARSYLKNKITYKSNSLNELLVWDRVIAMVKPKCVVAIQPSSDLCYAGFKVRIPVYDLQHGIIEPSVYYNSDLKQKYGSDGLPTGCLCWDDSSKKALEVSLPDIQGIVIGHPWLARYQSVAQNDQLVKQELYAIKTNLSVYDPILIVTLQWDESKPWVICIPFNIKIAIKRLIVLGWKCWIRFHPVQLQKMGNSNLRKLWEKQTKLKFESGHIEDVSQYALPALFKYATVHLTESSASAIEATCMGIKSIVWRDDKQVRLWFKEYINSGSISMAGNSAEEVCEAVVASQLDRVGICNKSYYFFSDESKTNDFIDSRL